MAAALALALTLMAQGPAAAKDAGEPLPAGAPTDPYELTAWCYGAMSEYLDIYDQVKPDLRAIDKLFGSSVKDEVDPYSADMLAAHAELKMLAGGVEAAEKASAQPIAPRGVRAIKLGRSVWSPAEQKSRRELADAWLTWALPDKCDTVAKSLTANSKVLGAALTYNASDAAQDAPPAAAASGEAAPATSDTAAAPQPDAIGATLASPPSSNPAPAPSAPESVAPPAPEAAPGAPPG